MSKQDKIWIVDDDKSIRWVLEKALEKTDADIQSFSKPEEMLKRILNEQPDVIISDIRMPGMDGIETAQKIRADNGLSSAAPIVALTANALDGDKQACLDAGMDDYLCKPIDASALRDKVADWVEPAPSAVQTTSKARPEPTDDLDSSESRESGAHRLAQLTG